MKEKNNKRNKFKIAGMIFGLIFVINILIWLDEKIVYSDSILFSINSGAPGYGTKIDCIDALITVYTGGLVEVTMRDEHELTVSQFYLDTKDYAILKFIASPRRLAGMNVVEDLTVCDGSSNYVVLYDKNNEICKQVGGYSVLSGRFNLTYAIIEEILDGYGVDEAIKAYKEKCRSVESEVGQYKFSSNILFSINNGAAGYGTEADCTDAEIVVYTDGTVRVFMDVEGNPEVACIQLSAEDYLQLERNASPEKIGILMVAHDDNVCDGNSSHITLYDENDEELLSKGGYMVEGKQYHKIYGEIKEMLAPYGIKEKVEEYRDMMRQEE